MPDVLFSQCTNRPLLFRLGGKADADPRGDEQWRHAATQRRECMLSTWTGSVMFRITGVSRDKQVLLRELA